MAAGTARLQIREIGAGPSIVVLHGGPDFGYDYLLPELDRLAERFRLVYYDQRGRGRLAETQCALWPVLLRRGCLGANCTRTRGTTPGSPPSR